MADDRYSIPLGMDSETQPQAPTRRPEAPAAGVGAAVRQAKFFPPNVTPLIVRANREAAIVRQAQTQQARGWPSPNLGVGRHNNDHTPIEFSLAAGQSLQLLGSDPGRVYFIIVNNGAAGGNSFFVSCGKPATAASMPIYAGGGFWEPLKAPTNAVWVYAAAAATGVLHVAGLGNL